MATTEKFAEALARRLATTCQSFIKKGQDTNPMFSLVKNNDVEMMVMTKGTDGEEDRQAEKHEQFWQICMVAAVLRCDALLMVCDSWYSSPEIPPGEELDLSDIQPPSEDPSAKECVLVQVAFLGGRSWMMMYPYGRNDDGTIRWEKVKNTREDAHEFEGPVAQMLKTALDPEFQEEQPDFLSMSEAFGFDPKMNPKEVRYHAVRGAARFLSIQGHEVLAWGEEVG